MADDRFSINIGKLVKDPEELVLLSPDIPPPTHIWVESPEGEEQAIPLAEIGNRIGRPDWVMDNRVYIHRKDLKFLEKKSISDFDFDKIREGLNTWYDRTIIYKVSDACGFGVKVRRGQVLPKDTFIICSGIIEKHSGENKHYSFIYSNCKAPTGQGGYCITPLKKGGDWMLVNHTPTHAELEKTFNLEAEELNQIAAPNMESGVAYYNGILMPLLKVTEDITGGTQLLYEYAEFCALEHPSVLFRAGSSEEYIIDPKKIKTYTLDFPNGDQFVVPIFKLANLIQQGKDANADELYFNGREEHTVSIKKLEEDLGLSKFNYAIPVPDDFEKDKERRLSDTIALHRGKTVGMRQFEDNIFLIIQFDPRVLKREYRDSLQINRIKITLGSDVEARRDMLKTAAGGLITVEKTAEPNVFFITYPKQFQKIVDEIVFDKKWASKKAMGGGAPAPRI